MENDWIRIDAPVPPEPILENAVGYHNQRGARHIALWWEPAGDEVMVSDGFVTFTGHWPGYWPSFTIRRCTRTWQSIPWDHRMSLLGRGW